MKRNQISTQIFEWAKFKFFVICQKTCACIKKFVEWQQNRKNRLVKSYIYSHELNHIIATTSFMSRVLDNHQATKLKERICIFFFCHSHSHSHSHIALCNVYPVVLDSTRR